ncbi:MAG: MarR family winged helix-turn-helix transcriptional regulator [Acidimicrobiia bacterium]
MARAKFGGEAAEAGGVRLRSSVLLALECLEDEASSLTQLGRQQGLTTPAVSRQVQGLERMGLVERVPDATDGRATIIRLTERGHRLAQKEHAARTEFLLKVLNSWPSDDLHRLAADLERLSRDFAVEANAPQSTQTAPRASRKGGG